MTGAMTKVRENGATSGIGLLAVYSYDNLGRRTSVTRGNGVSTTYAYDAASRLNSLTQNLAGATNDLTATFSHNPAGQISSRTASNDLYAWTDHTNMDQSTLVNGRNQVTSEGGISFSYDARGNMTSDGVNAYNYDADNRLISGSGGLSLDYDALGRLYEEDSSALAATRFLYDGSHLIAEYNASGSLLRRYVYGAGSDEPLVWYEGNGTSDRRWLLVDERGSIIAVTNGSGSALAVNTYDEYGQGSSANLGRFQYTGQVWSEAAEAYYYKTRFYAPEHGRFLQTDRIGYSGGLNLYAYAVGDPVNLVDPSGTIEEVIFYYDPSLGCGRSGERCSAAAAAAAAAAAQAAHAAAVVGGTGATSDGTGTGSADTTAPPEGIEQFTVVGRRSGSTTNWAYWTGAGFNLAGLITGYFQNHYLNDGMWRGRNGKMNSLTWGGNGYTGPRSTVLGRVARLKAAGYVAFVAGTTISGVQFYEAFQTRDNFGMVRSGMDITWGGIATFGGWAGLAGGVSYFGTSYILDNYPGARSAVVTPIVDFACALSGC